MADASKIGQWLLKGQENSFSGDMGRFDFRWGVSYKFGI
jgi:hypothetical protein